jgi:serine/threonine-protein kinase RsbW
MIQRSFHARASPACLEKLHELLTGVWQHAPSVGDAVRLRMTIALGELVGNIVEHGARRTGTPIEIDLVVTVDDRQIRACVTDDGDAVKPPPHLATLPEDELAEGGRGIALARAAVDDLDYSREDDHNVWRLVLVRTPN